MYSICTSHSNKTIIIPPGWQKVVQAMKNSSYFESLEAKAKERYYEKLSCVGLSIQDDPYLPKNDARFVNDMPPGHGISSVIHWRSTGLPRVKQYNSPDRFLPSSPGNSWKFIKSQVLGVPQSDYYSHKRNSSLPFLYHCQNILTERMYPCMARWPYH